MNDTTSWTGPAEFAPEYLPIPGEPNDDARKGQPEENAELLAALLARVDGLEDGMRSAQDVILVLGERLSKVRRALLKVNEALADLSTDWLLPSAQG